MTNLLVTVIVKLDMFKIKDKKLAEQIEKGPIKKEQFESLLKKACEQKPKPSPKSSKT